MKTIQKIPLTQIDLNDETFSVNFMADLERLRSSIEEVGLIQPVLLRKQGDAYQIISGFRRISVFKDLGHSEIEARISGKEDGDEPGLFSLALHENMMTRGFNSAEKAIALDKLVHRFLLDPTVVIRTFLPLLSLEPHEKILKTYLSLAGMEEEVKNYVVKEEVSRQNIRLLSGYTSEDRQAVIRLLPYLKLTDSRLREILTLVEEVSRRDGTPVRDILNRPEIGQVLSEKALTSSQRAERLKKVVTHLRYPRRRQMEMDFESRKRNLDLSSGISIYHSPHFEDPTLRIEFQFETLEEYRAVVSSLAALSEKEAFREMVEQGIHESKFKVQSSNAKGMSNVKNANENECGE